MLFNSLEFLVFLPITFLIYWLLLKKSKERNIFLLAASYLFYGWWDYRFLSLIIAISAISWGSGILLHRFINRCMLRVMILWSMIIISIGTLIVFKYFNFFSQEFSRILNYAGFEVDNITLDIVLPVGISFYTLQALSYVIDVYRKAIPVQKDPLPFFVFIAFFPQLIAGPIERATNLIPQFTKNREFTYQMGSSGMKLILWGLFKKMVVADNAANDVHLIFSNPDEVGTLNLWMGAILFSFQIYGDFSGYSDIAIGTARLFGIRLMRNFHMPYLSRNIAEFWSRWHISLTSWLRDYIYIPLGGNRRGKGKRLRNSFIVFLTSGLWHGANLTFIAWGAYNALLLLPLSISNVRNKTKECATNSLNWQFPATVLSIGGTYILILIGMVIFRSHDIFCAWHYLTLMFSHFNPTPDIYGLTVIPWICILLIIEWIGRDNDNPLILSDTGLFRFPIIRWCFYVAFYLIIILFSGISSNFIYFRF